MTESELHKRLMDALVGPFQRVQRLDLTDGRRFWLKREERLSGRLRLQKGDPGRAFAAECEGLRALDAAGLPVAGIVAEGRGWILLPDAGPTLPEVAEDRALSDKDKFTAFASAGRALADLHWAGLVHGRPAVRDICWDGTAARFIDLERFRRGPRAGFWQAADLVMFVQTCFTRWPDDPRWVDAALGAYAGAAPPEAMGRSARLALWLTPLAWLAAMVSRIKPESRELKAVTLTLGRLRQDSGNGPRCPA